jgi:hypothetical protein
LAKAESIAENLSAVLAGLSVEAGKIIKRVSILAGQLEKVSLSLIVFREKDIIRASKSEYIRCRLITSRIKDYASQTTEIIC